MPFRTLILAALTFAAPTHAVTLAQNAFSLMNIQCLNQIQPSAENMSRARSMLHGGQLSSRQVTQVAALLQRIDMLGGGSALAELNVRVYNNRSKPYGDPCKSYTPGGRIDLVNNSCTVSGDNTVKTLAHEMGHFVAQKRGLYGAYAGYMQNGHSRCDVTNYMRTQGGGGRASDYSEEVGDAFAMYILAPDILANNCPDTFRFMKDNVFNRFPSSVRPDPRTSCSGDPNGHSFISGQATGDGPVAGVNNNGLGGQMGGLSQILGMAMNPGSPLMQYLNPQGQLGAQDPNQLQLNDQLPVQKKEPVQTVTPWNNNPWVNGGEGTQ